MMEHAPAVALPGGQGCFERDKTMHASPSMRKRSGRELCYALQKRDQESAIALIDAGASLEAMVDGNAPLHWAVFANQRELIPLLVRAGANIEQKNERNFSPLHLACSNGYLQVAEELLVQGASVHAKGGEHGRTAKDMVQKSHPNPQFFPGLLKDYEQLPAFSLKALPPRGELDRQNRCGKSLLHHPAFWERLDEVNTVLESRGEQPFGRDDVLQPANNGLPLLVYTMRLRTFTDGAPILSGIMRALEMQGQRLEMQDLLKEDGSPTHVLEAITQNDAAPLLFTPEQWRGHDLREVQKLYRALPETAQREVKNFHALVAELRAASRQAVQEAACR